MAKSMRSKSRKRAKAVLRSGIYLPAARERAQRLAAKSKTVPIKASVSDPGPMEVASDGQTIN